MTRSCCYDPITPYASVLLQSSRLFVYHTVGLTGCVVPLHIVGNMVMHGHDPTPLMDEGGPQSNPGSNQPMLLSPIEIAGYAKGVESPTARHANVLVGNVSKAASDEKRMGDSAVNGNGIQRQRSFDSKLSDLERMLAVRQKMDPDSPKIFDDIIRTQIETLVPAFDMENRESSMARYVKRLAEMRKCIFSQWKPMDNNGWNGDCDHSTKRIDQIMAELMRIMDVESNSGLERDLDPLTALESLSNTKDELFDKHGLEKNVDALIEQKLRALSLAQHSQYQASHSCPVLSVIPTNSRVVQTVDAFNRGRAEAVQMYRAPKDKAADLQIQVADLRKDLELANEKIHQAQSDHSLNVGILASNANAWATPPSSSVPTQCTPSIFNPSVPDTIRAPVEVINYGPSLPGPRPIEVPTSSFPHVVSYTPPSDPRYATPGGLFGKPIIKPVDQRYHGHGTGYDLGGYHRSNFGLFNTGFRPMETQMPLPPLNMPPPADFHAVEPTGSGPPNNTNVWPAFTSMPPSAQMQAFNEGHKQMREASIIQSRGSHGFTRTNQ